MQMTWASSALIPLLLVLVACSVQIPAGTDIRRSDHFVDGSETGSSNSCQDDSDCPHEAPCLRASCKNGSCTTVPDDQLACDDGSLCTLNDRCLAGGCTGTNLVCDDGNPCTEDACRPKDGVCQSTVREGPCDDGSICTTGDLCQDGLCIGQGLACDDGNTCTVDSCNGQAGCAHLPLSGLVCNDGSPCTQKDNCLDGTCLGEAVDCQSDSPCTAGSCAPDSGKCIYEALDGNACDDGNNCTLGDLCLEGTCQGGPFLACDDGNPCTVDSCDALSGCSYLAEPLPCDDGNPCTQADTCSLGSCFAGPAKGCQDGNPCTLDTCDLNDGTCLHEAVDWACDDGNPCSVEDSCQAGECVGVPANCDDGNPCTIGTCQPDIGCDYSPVGAPCDDGNLCTIGDICQQGACQPGPGKPFCDDDNPCTDDLCDLDGGLCVNLPNQGECDDGNNCTTGDHCANGLCLPGDTGLCQCESDADCLPFDDGNACNGVVHCALEQWPPKCEVEPGTVVECSGVFDKQCRKAQCQPASGMCLLTDLPDNTICSDGNPCTTLDRCTAGFCLPKGVVDCDDLNPCTAEACEPESGCVFTTQSMPCDDGNTCTLGDLCVGGNCIGVPKHCEDGNPCTIGTCQPESGECVYPFALGSCDDDNPCTQEDHCDAGACIGIPTSCDDANECTADACNGTDGCVHVVIDGSCEDGNACTALDQCEAGKCKGVGITCNDENPCTDDICDPAVGCLHPANVAPCSDGDLCTYGDKCDSGVCGGLPVSCEDGNPCTTKSCHYLAGCLVANLYIPCGDGSLCTVGDWCIDGVCTAGPPVVCDDGNPCTVDSCDPVTGLCIYGNTGWPCDDGNACTHLDHCGDGACAGYSVTCTDENHCTTDSCDAEEGCLHSALDGAQCDDGNPCTAGDLCILDECVGQEPVVCNDKNVCTADSCHSVLGCMFTGETGADCNDGDDSTIDDACQEGTCVGLADADADGVAEEGYEEACAGGNVDSCTDNCPNHPNPTQDDSDGDAIGDLCEACGAAQAFDGLTTPDEAVWKVEYTDVCPELYFVTQATTVDGEDLLEFRGNRAADCGSDIVHVSLANLADLSGQHTVIQVDMGLEGTVYPAQFLGMPLAFTAIGNGEQRVDLVSISHATTDTECGATATIPPAFARALWRIEVDGIANQASVFVNDVEHADSPVSLGDLAPPWQLEFGVLGGDLVGGCGGTAAVLLYAYDNLCQW